jgi:SUMO ligase MMS21 Smc5/6 complex component
MAKPEKEMVEVRVSFSSGSPMCPLIVLSILQEKEKMMESARKGAKA